MQDDDIEQYPGDNGGDNSGDDKIHPFDTLTPDTIVAAIEASGRLSDLRNFPLNSYENRVYQIGIEGELPIIAKFYRPERWNKDQILEEHQFTRELQNGEIPVVAPLADEHGNTLFRHDNFYFALFPRVGGYAPEPGDLDQLYRIGQWLGRLHAISATQSFQHRPTINIEEFGTQSANFLTEHFIPDSLLPAYTSLTSDLLRLVEERYQPSTQDLIRCHGDCHLGNLLLRDETLFFVDFDDCRMAPAIQDMWMLLAGERQEQTAQLTELVAGYEEFNDFNAAQLNWLEPLRTLRLIHYAAWLARRWDDPAFPMAFPWFNTERYWSNHILQLREQLSALQEPPLTLWR
jgi:Ser/Thr protein kinase RdoA (MazF antagonist)